MAFVATTGHLRTFMQAQRNTGDRVYEAIRELIVSGELGPGEPLVQRQLAKRFGTSSIPVVEALRRLEQDGLVDGCANWSSTVRRWTFEEIEGIYLAREALEGVTCRLFAERASAAERVRLEELEHEFDAAIDPGDRKICCDLDVELHLHIARCSRTAVLPRVLKNSCVIATTVYHPEWNPVTTWTGPVGVHRELVAALTRGTPAAAERAGKAHVREALDRIRHGRRQKEVG
jgi:DNA-binding GntR family transcriptional regulator